MIDNLFAKTEYLGIESMIKSMGGEVVDSNADYCISSQPLEMNCPVVDIKWLEDTLEETSIQPTSRYSLDPMKFLSGFIVYCYGMNSSDVEAIYGGLKAFGGEFRMGLTADITHIATLDDKNKTCIEYRKKGVKIILPHYFDDCFRLLIKCPIANYLFPDPICLRPFELQKIEKPPLIPKSDIFQDHIIYSVDELPFSVEDHGAQLRDFSIATTILIVDVKCEIYFSALKLGILIGTKRWISDCISHSKLLSPKSKVLYQPRPLEPLEEMKNCVIAITNYSGAAREDIKTMAEHLGAKLTLDMSQKHTHLICAFPVGQKYEKACEWNLHIVNHLWLEETYASWTYQKEGKSHYTHFASCLGQLVNEKYPKDASRSSQKSKRIKLEPQEICVLFTGIRPVDSAQEARLSDLGIKIVNDPYQCHVLIASNIIRTEKFLIAVSRGIPIKNSGWIDSYLQTGKPPPENTFSLLDTEAEKKYNFTLLEALHRAKKKPLFKGKNMYCTSSILPSKSIAERLIIAAGGNLVKKEKLEPNDIVFSCISDHAEHGYLRQKGDIV